MNNEKSQITHKELLVFSNLTNLEWEFAELKIENDGKEDEDFETTSEEYKPLIDILTPEVFIREYEDGTEENTYGTDEYGNFNRDLGLIEMRKKAGIAMEYLEKSDEGQEGEFLKDWEVIYGADQYEIAAEYLDERDELIKGVAKKLLEEAKVDKPEGFDDFMAGKFYFSRKDLEEKLEEAEERKSLKYKINMIGNAVIVISNSSTSLKLGSMLSDTLWGLKDDALGVIGNKLPEDSEAREFFNNFHFFNTLLNAPGRFSLKF